MGAITLGVQDSHDTPSPGKAKMYVGTDKKPRIKDDTGNINLIGGNNDLESEELTYTDTGNKVAGPLSGIPTDMDKVSLFVIGGCIQRYTTDYTVREVTGGSAPGYYLCFSPTSTAPGGGGFNGGTNPATGISDILENGDVVRIIYPLDYLA